jgi:putative peptidoglycan lipid II flippase
LSAIVGEGGVAGLYFAYRLILFPIGIFSTSLSQAILPTFSTQALEDNHDKLKHTLSFGLRATSFVLVPSTVAFMVLAHQIISTIFRGGRFDAYSATLTADVLFYYSIGLLAYGSTRILQSCFFALKDTMTPTKNSFLALIINIVFILILMYPMKVAGIALATSISGVCSFTVLFLRLKKRLGDFRISEIASSFMRILAASLLMGVVCYFLRSLNLGIVILAGVISYIIFCFIFRVREMRDLWGMVTRI